MLKSDSKSKDLPRLKVALVCAVVGFVVLSKPAVCANKGELGWLLEQKHNMNGRQRMFISLTKVRVDNLDLGYSLVADVAHSTVSVFHPKKKLRYSTPLEKFSWRLSKAFLYANAEAPPAAKWKKVASGRTNDLTSDCFRCSEETTYFRGSKVGGGYLAGSKRKATVTYSVFVTNEIATSSALVKVIDELQGVPPLIPGFPLFMKSYYSDTRTTRIPIETKEVKKQKLADSVWYVPSGYKTAKNISEVTSGDMTFLQDLVGD